MRFWYRELKKKKMLTFSMQKSLYIEPTIKDTGTILQGREPPTGHRTKTSQWILRLRREGFSTAEINWSREAEGERGVTARCDERPEFDDIAERRISRV